MRSSLDQAFALLKEWRASKCFVAAVITSSDGMNSMFKAGELVRFSGNVISLRVAGKRLPIKLGRELVSVSARRARPAAIRILTNTFQCFLIPLPRQNAVSVG
jgi:hypothetical protein